MDDRLRRLAGAAAALCFFATSVGADAAARQTSAPPAQGVDAQAETPALRQAMAFLKAANADQATFLKFAADTAKAVPIPADVWRNFAPILHKLRLHAVVSAGPTTADLLVYDGQWEGWAHLLITVEDHAPYGITNVGLQMTKPPADVPPPPKLTPTELVAAAKARAEAMTGEDLFSGAVLIAKDGKPIFEAPYGLADRAAQTPVTLQTQFRFGSMGKMFTAVSIMQLAEAGKLDLKAPIGRYLTDYPNAEIASKVTIENLLTHTGGTGDIFGPEFDAHRLTLKDAKDYVALYGARAPLFPPGTKQAYSNYGFMLLGRIVEVVSGQSYNDYIAQHIFAPAHMTATGNQPETVKLNRAAGYMSRDGGLKDAADTLPWSGTPAGGGYSTVGDLLAFADALMDHRLLNEAGWRQLTTGQITGPGGLIARYDFGDETFEGRRFLGHAGGAPGMNGELRIFPDAGYTIVVLANRDPPVADVLANFISDRLP